VPGAIDRTHPAACSTSSGRPRALQPFA
jgi:hypothetical protein